MVRDDDGPAPAKHKEGPRPETRREELPFPAVEDGTGWLGGTLRREELYGDDGR
jgi:hypothetical protein